MSFSLFGSVSTAKPNPEPPKDLPHGVETGPIYKDQPAKSIPAVKTGYLYKQGGNHKTWKFRWFALERATRTIYYYATPKDAKALGWIPLHGCEIRTFTQEFKGKKIGFSINHPDRRTFFLLAEESTDIFSWQELIQQIIDEQKHSEEAEIQLWKERYFGQESEKRISWGSFLQDLEVQLGFQLADSVEYELRYMLITLCSDPNQPLDELSVRQLTMYTDKFGPVTRNISHPQQFCKYYHGAMSLDRAEKKLLDMPHGTYFMWLQGFPGCLTVSHMGVNSTIKHNPIKMEPHTSNFYLNKLDPGDPTEPTIDGVIQRYPRKFKTPILSPFHLFIKEFKNEKANKKISSPPPKHDTPPSTATSPPTNPNPNPPVNNENFPSNKPKPRINVHDSELRGTSPSFLQELGKNAANTNKMIKTTETNIPRKAKTVKPSSPRTNNSNSNLNASPSTSTTNNTNNENARSTGRARSDSDEFDGEAVDLTIRYYLEDKPNAKGYKLSTQVRKERLSKRDILDLLRKVGVRHIEKISWRVHIAVSRTGVNNNPRWIALSSRNTSSRDKKNRDDDDASIPVFSGCEIDLLVIRKPREHTSKSSSSESSHKSGKQPPARPNRTHKKSPEPTVSRIPNSSSSLASPAPPSLSPEPQPPTSNPAPTSPVLTVSGRTNHNVIVQEMDEPPEHHKHLQIRDEPVIISDQSDSLKISDTPELLEDPEPDNESSSVSTAAPVASESTSHTPQDPQESQEQIEIYQIVEEKIGESTESLEQIRTGEENPRERAETEIQYFSIVEEEVEEEEVYEKDDYDDYSDSDLDSSENEDDDREKPDDSNHDQNTENTANASNEVHNAGHDNHPSESDNHTAFHRAPAMTNAGFGGALGPSSGLFQVGDLQRRSKALTLTDARLSFEFDNMSDRIQRMQGAQN